MNSSDKYKFVADINVGKLAKWLRVMGYDTLIFRGADDTGMLTLALAEERIILTRDTKFMERRAVKKGEVRAILIRGDELEAQVGDIISELKLPCAYEPFLICIECNELLVKREKPEVRERVPAYVYATQEEFMECPQCHRVYWKGTHWRQMGDRLAELRKDCYPDKPI